MCVLSSISAQLRPVPDTTLSEEVHEMPRTNDPKNGDDKNNADVDVEALQKPVFDPHPPIEASVAAIEAVQAVWGKRGRYFIIAGLAMTMIMYELDNSTVYVYQNYATPAFNSISLLGTLSTARVIVFAVIKPPIAKLSNIIGRGEAYILTISCYLLSYILCTSAKSINVYAAGYTFYCISGSGTNIMNEIIISDITTARWRGFGIGISFRSSSYLGVLSLSLKA
ncbi:MFS general substrate transporter [Acephala macrosclerotiorum]|nr:MFS general substrate transporter [Acephala macrosclerotiorum]